MSRVPFLAQSNTPRGFVFYDIHAVIAPKIIDCPLATHDRLVIVHVATLIARWPRPTSHRPPLPLTFTVRRSFDLFAGDQHAAIKPSPHRTSRIDTHALPLLPEQLPLLVLFFRRRVTIWLPRLTGTHSLKYLAGNHPRASSIAALQRLSLGLICVC